MVSTEPKCVKLLSTEQVIALRSEPLYQKTKGIRYNWKYSKAIVSAPTFSIQIDITMGDKSWSQLNILLKLFLWTFKRCYISKEIGSYRNKVVENILDESCDINFDISSLIDSGMVWISRSRDKMKLIKNLVSSFICDLPVKLLIFSCGGIPEDRRHEFMKYVMYKLDCIFKYTIARLLNEQKITSQQEYDKFIILNGDLILDQMLSQFRTGFLTDNNEKEAK